MKKNKKQRKSETLVKFHKGILKLSINEGTQNFIHTCVGKRKGMDLISYKFGYSGIKWAMVRVFKYAPNLHMPKLNRDRKVALKKLVEWANKSK